MLYSNLGSIHSSIARHLKTVALSDAEVTLKEERGLPVLRVKLLDRNYVHTLDPDEAEHHSGKLEEELPGVVARALTLRPSLFLIGVGRTSYDGLIYVNEWRRPYFDYQTVEQIRAHESGSRLPAHDLPRYDEVEDIWYFPRRATAAKGEDHRTPDGGTRRLYALHGERWDWDEALGR